MYGVVRHACSMDDHTLHVDAVKKKWTLKTAFVIYFIEKAVPAWVPMRVIRQ